MNKKAKDAYDKLIASAQRRKRSLPMYEKHHILPKFAGGTNLKTNLVLLSPRNHYRAHKLLARVYEGTCYERAAASAFWLMTHRTKRTGGKLRGYRVSAASYSEAKTRFARVSKPCMFLTPEAREKIAEKNRERLKGKPAYNRGSVSSEKTKKLVSIRTREAMAAPEVKAKIVGPKSEEHKRALSKAARKRKKVTCSKCKATMDPGLFVRWGHGAKCKK